MDPWNLMKPALWSCFRIVSRLGLIANRHRYRYILVLAHMRSGSTLLSHILASHPNIVGAGETHVSYQTPTDLDNLVIRTGEFLHRPILRETYIVDQIVHDYVTDEVLLTEKVCRCIILVREPESTLKSLMNLPMENEKDALELYVRRLKTLGRYGQLIGRKAVLLEYDDLVDHTDECLNKLTSFLGVKPPLSSTYTTHRMTGRIYGFGDPSSNIKVGRVIRTPKYETTISEETLVRATSAYRDCLRELQANIPRTFDPKPSSSLRRSDLKM